MVFKKPYAFLIKHFRALHLVLFGCLLYLFLQMNDLYNLFATLQRTSTYTYSGTDVYVNNVVYFFALVGIGLSGVIFWLFKIKKKPLKLYVGMIIYFVAYIIATWYLYIQLGVLKIKVVNVDTLILYKDVSLLILIPCYVLLFLTFIRGIGFNIKHFNFSKDISELQIADMDSSEVEVLIGQNNYKYIRTIRRTIRELKYYFFENKYVISLVAIAVGGVFLLISAIYNFKYNKRIDLSESTSVDGIIYTVNASYVTAYDDMGSLIRKGYKYVVVNINLFNTTYDARYVDFTKVFLSNGSLKYLPSFTKNSRFYDLGIPYAKNELIPAGSELNRLFIFEIPDTVKTKKFTFNVQYAIDNTVDDIIARHKKFAVNARNIDNKLKVVSKSIGNNIGSNTLGVNKVDFKINSYNIQDTYNNRYVLCFDVDNCKLMSSVIKTNDTSLYTMLVINYEGNMYEGANITNKYNTFNKLLSRYASITYKKNGKYVTVPLEMTTDDEVNNMVFLKVDRKILKSPDITFNLNFRNYRYEVVLKK